MEVSLVFPHQLYEFNPCTKTGRKVYIIEDHLYFTQYKFHKQKLILHRASMRSYEDYLKKYGFDVEYIEFHKYQSLRLFLDHLSTIGVTKIYHVETVDYHLEQIIEKACIDLDIDRELFLTPNFMLKHEELAEMFPNKKYQMADFYIKQRIKNDILVENGRPVGGKWSFDTENRKKIPSNVKLPKIAFPLHNLYVVEAINYIEKHFPDNYGSSDDFYYPVNFADAIHFLDDFLVNRLKDFGSYQDAILSDSTFIFHSVLSPVINIGLLSPEYIVTRALEFNSDYDYPMNSLEGFIRQIIGWREYIRATYVLEGNLIRSNNVRNYTKKIPPGFWNASTGILPLDDSIKKVLKYGWNHHIERLMVIGNFMLLCEFSPDEVYSWFMELYVDAFDWVMVPNVFGMSQSADGGLIATKPYISSSNYILKMSNYNKDTWCEIWDALYWRFIFVNRDTLAKNSRMKLIVHQVDQMDKSKIDNYIKLADDFLSKL